MNDEKERAIVEIKRLINELRMTLIDEDGCQDIYNLCESIMVTIEEADLF